MAWEVHEEYGVRPLGIEQLGVRTVLRGDPVDSHWVAVVFAVRVEPDAVRIGEPHKLDALAWFTPESLPVPPHSQCGETLELFATAAREGWPGRRFGAEHGGGRAGAGTLGAPAPARGPTSARCRSVHRPPVSAGA